MTASGPPLRPLSTSRPSERTSCRAAADDLPVARRRPHHRREHAVVEPVPPVLPATARGPGLVLDQAVGLQPVEPGRVAGQPAGDRSEQRGVGRVGPGQHAGRPGGLLGPPGEREQVPSEPMITSAIIDGRPSTHTSSRTLAPRSTSPTRWAPMASTIGRSTRSVGPVDPRQVGRLLDQPEGGGRVATGVGEHEAEPERRLLGDGVAAGGGSPPSPRRRGRRSPGLGRRAWRAYGVEQEQLGAIACAAARPAARPPAVSTGSADSVLRTSASDAAHRASVSPRRAASEPAADVRSRRRAGARRPPGPSPGPRRRARSRPACRATGRGRGSGRRRCGRPSAPSRTSWSRSTRRAAERRQGVGVGGPHRRQREQRPEVVGLEPADDLLPHELPAPGAVGVCRPGRPEGEAHQRRPAAEAVQAR